MRKLLYLVLLLLLVPLLVAFFLEGVRFVLAVFSLAATMWFLIGAAVAFLVMVLLLHNSFGFLQVLLHELEHSVMYFLLTFHWPTAMQITPPTGVTLVGLPSRFLAFVLAPLITLAPYFLPLLTLPFLLLKGLAALVFSLLEMPFPGFLSAILDLLIGATLMLHLLTTIHELLENQSDTQSLGGIFSFVNIIFLYFMFVVLSIAVVTGSYAAYLAYLKTAFERAWEMYQAIWAWLKVELPPALNTLRQGLKELL